MALHGIKLTASQDNWRLFTLRRADQAFLKFQEKIFTRDEHSCQFCGFSAKHHQEVINLDGNYSNNKTSNLITSCSLCAQCFFLESIGQSDFGGGTLICLPQMAQSALNALSHTLFASMISANHYATTAKNIYRSLKLRAQLVEKQLAEGYSNPSLYGRMLIETDHKQAQAFDAKIMQNVRLLPSLNHYVLEIKEQANHAIESMLH